MSKYIIYQINSDEHVELLFEQWNPSRGADKRNYKKVYTGEIEGYNHEDQLEELFWKFNAERPEEFKGHSLSVSDVVVIDGDAYYCDSFGWEEIPDWQEER